MTLSAQNALKEAGFAFLENASLSVAQQTNALHSNALAEQWNDLEPDYYLRGNATFRKRRYGRFAFQPGLRSIKLLPHKPYYQSRAANCYAGGVERVLAPLTPEFLNNPFLQALIEYDYSIFPTTPLQDRGWWVIACHQFRIVGTADADGKPTPEGVHRDEIDFGAMHLMGRENVSGGHSRIHFNDRRIKAEVVMRNHLDTLFWNDRMILHSATPIKPVNPAADAVRDILVLGFTQQSEFDLEDPLPC